MYIMTLANAASSAVDVATRSLLRECLRTRICGLLAPRRRIFRVATTAKLDITRHVPKNITVI